MTLLNHNNYNVFNDVEFIQYEGKTGTDYMYEILDKSGRLFKFFLPSNKVRYEIELLLSYYSQIKLNRINDFHKSNNVLLFKNFNSSTELILFDHKNKEYSFTPCMETHKVDQSISEEIKNLVIELNLDLIKLNYVHK